MAFNHAMILGGDVGGTKVDLGLFQVEAERLQLKAENKYASRSYKRFQDLVREFLERNGSPPVERACFGIAGPVRDGRVHLTNLPWELEAAEVSQELKLGAVSLINDLEANAYGLAELPSTDLHTLHAGEAGARGNAAIISAGTGLGEAGMFWDGQRHHPFSCEGGHGDFAPQTELDAQLFDYLHEQFGHVSWEKVLSGAGLHNIYQFLLKAGLGEDPPTFAAALSQGDPAVTITLAALDRGSSRCVQALELFITYYGAEAGNLALKMMAAGGVYLGGGIVPRILDRLEEGGFMKAFLGKGRMESLLELMPVRVIINQKAALLGAGHYAAFGSQSISRPPV
jgi:glucokinase